MMVATLANAVAIEELREGDLVCWAGSDGAVARETLVFSAGTTGYAERVVEVMIDGESIRSTRNRPYWTKNKGSVEAGRPAVGDELQTPSAATVTVLGVREVHLDYGVRVYDVRCVAGGTFFVGRSDVLVHEFCSASVFGSCASSR
jgi:hypothetical protein